jgi:iron(III) transport system substrate-binding protein
MKKLLQQCLFIAAVTVCLVLPAAAQQADARPDTISADSMAGIVAAAKKEGSLTWYTSITPADSAQLIKKFESKYGIKVTVWRSGDDNVLQRVIAETNAKTYKADVAQIQTSDMEALVHEKLLLPINSSTFSDLVPGAVPKHREWAMAQITLFVMAYNTNLVKKEDLPHSFKDLLDPKWKGKLGIEGTDNDWLYTIADNLGGDAGYKLFRQIKQTNGLSVRTGHSLLANLVAAGEVPLALTVYQYKAVQLKRGGAPIDWFTMDPVVAYATGLGILNHAGHPNAALLFYDFMLNDGQAVMASIDNVPSNTKIASPLKTAKIRFIEPVAAMEQSDKRQKRFDDIIIRN